MSLGKRELGQVDSRPERLHLEDPGHRPHGRLLAALEREDPRRGDGAERKAALRVPEPRRGGLHPHESHGGGRVGVVVGLNLPGRRAGDV